MSCQINQLRSAIKSLFSALLLFLVPGLALGQAGVGKLSPIEKVQVLHLDSTEAGVLLFYSNGYSARGVKISKQIEKDKQFYEDSLGVDVQIKVALLDAKDFAKIPSGYPYGMPFEEHGWIMMPADTSIGVVRDMYAPFGKTASENIIANLKKAGFNYKDALNHMVDLVGLHEIGHAEIYAYGMKTRQKWFGEFMASYFAYAYMRVKEPTMAVIWDSFNDAGFFGYKPAHKTLDLFNELYAKVGVDDYVWFQDAFQERVREVYAKQGLNFIRLVHERLADPSFKPVRADELLNELEKIEPGFIKWADSLKN